jgi:hypothetical protein
MNEKHQKGQKTQWNGINKRNSYLLLALTFYKLTCSVPLTQASRIHSQHACIPHEHNNPPFVTNINMNRTTNDTMGWTKICHEQGLVQHRAQDCEDSSTPVQPSLHFSCAILSWRCIPELHWQPTSKYYAIVCKPKVVHIITDLIFKFKTSPFSYILTQINSLSKVFWFLDLTINFLQLKRILFESIFKRYSSNILSTFFYQSEIITWATIYQFYVIAFVY